MEKGFGSAANDELKKSLKFILKNIFIILLLFSLQGSAQQDSTLVQSYYFNVSSKSTSRIEKIFSNDSLLLQQPDRELNQQFEGELKKVLLEKGNAGSVLEAKFVIKQYALFDENEQGLSVPFDMSELEELFYYKLSAENRIVDIQFQKNVSVSAQKVIRELIAHLQFKFVANATKTWEAAEDNPVGHCNILYQIVLRDGTKTFIQKNYVNYFATANEVNENFLKTVSLPEGSSTIEVLNTDRSLVRITGRQKIITLLNDKVVGTSEQKIYIVDTARKYISDDYLQMKYKLYRKMKNNLILSSIYLYVSPLQILIDNRRKTLGADSYSSIVAMLQTAGPVGSDSVYFKIRALCTVYPAYSRKFAAILDTGRASSVVYENIWQALLHTGNAESVNAICSVLKNHRNDWPWLKNIIGNLGLVKNCTDTLVSTLQQLYGITNNGSIKNTIELAMGTMVDNLSNVSKERSVNIYNWLIQKLNSKPVSDKNSFQKILVLGNTNYPPAKKIIEQYLDVSNEELSKLAVEQLEKFKENGK